MSLLLNDGSAAAPQLRLHLNLGNLADLRAGSLWPGLEGDARDARLRADGFDGVQLTDDGTAPARTRLRFTGLDRVNTPAEADAVVARHAARGDEALTLHVGWGLEGDAEAGRLVEAVLDASARHRLPVFIETHRATITQDLWRTVQLAQRFPEIRFNGDFSHYYCGHELVYGGFERKLEFMAPIFARTGYLHGRVASPGCMQVPIESVSARPRHAVGEADYLAHFHEMWTRAMRGFLGLARAGDVLVFAPELLSGRGYYARMVSDGAGGLVEETDRYAQALLLCDLARECWAEARRG